MILSKDVVEKLEEMNIFIDFKYNEETKDFEIFNSEDVVTDLIDKCIELKEKLEYKEEMEEVTDPYDYYGVSERDFI